MQKAKLYPSRAILARDSTGKIGTATWRIKHGVWFCCSASKLLRWMKGMENFETVKRQLASRQLQWEWIVPLYTAHPIAPPFKPDAIAAERT